MKSKDYSISYLDVISANYHSKNYLSDFVDRFISLNIIFSILLIFNMHNHRNHFEK